MRITIPSVFAALGLFVTAGFSHEVVMAPVTRPAGMNFDDAVFAVESAIIDAGLTIQTQSPAGEMLARTREDVGGTSDLFQNATIFTFCSAAVSRQVLEADLMNIQHCPYAIFVTQPAGSEEVTVGHRAYPPGMAPVTDLLTAILDDALGAP